jgi:hypothetical protein
VLLDSIEGKVDASEQNIVLLTVLFLENPRPGQFFNLGSSLSSSFFISTSLSTCISFDEKVCNGLNSLTVPHVTHTYMVLLLIQCLVEMAMFP